MRRARLPMAFRFEVECTPSERALATRMVQLEQDMTTPTKGRGHGQAGNSKE